MIAEIEGAAKAGDSLGGVRRGARLRRAARARLARALGPRASTGCIAQALMSIQAMKAVELGEGFSTAGRRGSDAHDEILWDAETGTYSRGSHRAGGTEGGMTTGDLLVARVVDEAARHAQPAGAEDGRRRDQGGDGLLQGAHRRHRGARGRGRRRDDGRARARVRGAAEVRRRLARPSSCGTTRRTSPRCRELGRECAPPGARRADGRGQDARSGAVCASGSARPFVDTDELVESATGHARRRDLRDPGRGGVPRARARPRSPTRARRPSRS